MFNATQIREFKRMLESKKDDCVYGAVYSSIALMVSQAFRGCFKTERICVHLEGPKQSLDSGAQILVSWNGIVVGYLLPSGKIRGLDPRFSYWPSGDNFYFYRYVDDEFPELEKPGLPEEPK